MNSQNFFVIEGRYPREGFKEYRPRYTLRALKVTIPILMRRGPGFSPLEYPAGSYIVWRENDRFEIMLADQFEKQYELTNAKY